MKETEYITPSGATVVIRDPQSTDFQKRLEKAVADFAKKFDNTKRIIHKDL